MSSALGANPTLLLCVFPSWGSTLLCYPARVCRCPLGRLRVWILCDPRDFKDLHVVFMMISCCGSNVWAKETQSLHCEWNSSEVSVSLRGIFLFHQVETSSPSVCPLLRGSGHALQAPGVAELSLRSTACTGPCSL